MWTGSLFFVFSPICVLCHVKEKLIEQRVFVNVLFFFCRKSPCSGDQQHTQKETDQGQNSEEPTVQRSLAVSEEIPEYIPEFSQESSGVEQLFRQEHAPSPSPECRPLSPSHYMKRLPPPPGFYLSKEHSYAQLCPLLWRRRYDQAIACLEKALRQLHAARRRENRLRSTVLRLRDKRLKHTLLVSQDGCNSKGSLSQGGEKKQGKEGSNQEESETHDKTDNTEFFKDRCVDHMELGGHSLPGTNSCSKKEKGYCLYCGREQVQVGGQVAHSLSKSDKDVQPTEDEHSEKIQRSVEISIYGTAENTKDTKLVRPERPFEKKVQTSNSDVAHFQILLQTPRLQHVIPTGVSLPDNDEQSLQFLGSKQKLLLSNMCEGESEAVGQEHQLDLQQQLFWIQDCPEGQVILVPVPAEDGLESFLKMEGVVDEAKTILVSGLDLKRDLEYMTENSGALPRVEKVCEDEHSDQHFVINNTLVERREDVREKLKEHLEGFHLQLSTEFIN